MNEPSKCLVILSGGQDSTTCLFWAKQKFNEVHAVTFNYGQKHDRELRSAGIVAGLAGVESLEIVQVGHILQGHSPLINPNGKLETYENFQQMDQIIGERVELTFVPMRNALFMVLAANRAACKDIYHIVAGVCQADNANYPDCRELYVERMQHAMNYALGLDLDKTKPSLQIITPLMNLSKAESIKLALEIPGAYDALAWTHTSYDNQFPPVGKDHATTLRAHGFEEAHVPDPLVVRAWNEDLMLLPETSNYDRLRKAHHDNRAFQIDPLNKLLRAGLLYPLT